MRNNVIENFDESVIMFIGVVFLVGVIIVGVLIL